MIGLVIGLGGDLLAQGTAQTIRGKVLDESGDPLPMASVLVVGTKVGVTTNTKGDFTIKLPAGKNQLLIRFVSYKSQTVTAKDGMVIKLQPEATTLDNIVVTGMVATDKRLFTGASDKLKADKVKMAGMADISRGLEGKSAGVSVQNLSGTFGTAPKIRVRGATSIMGSSKPLWVVDGVIQEDVVDVGADDLSSGGRYDAPQLSYRRPQCRRYRELPDPQGRLGNVHLRGKGYGRGHRHHDEEGSLG